jgi:hypothetical protein
LQVFKKPHKAEKASQSFAAAAAKNLKSVTQATCAAAGHSAGAAVSRLACNSFVEKGRWPFRQTDKGRRT